MLGETGKSGPLVAGLAALQRTHEVYRRARDHQQAAAAASVLSNSDAHSPDGDSTLKASPTITAPARHQAEKSLVASLRQLRSAQAAHQLASQHAAATQKQLEASLREAREIAAQQAAQFQEELRQERNRRAKLSAEKQETDVMLATLEQRLKTQEAASKKMTSLLESKLLDAANSHEALIAERDRLAAQLHQTERSRPAADATPSTVTGSAVATPRPQGRTEREWRELQSVVVELQFQLEGKQSQLEESERERASLREELAEKVKIIEELRDLLKDTGPRCCEMEKLVLCELRSG